MLVGITLVFGTVIIFCGIAMYMENNKSDDWEITSTMEVWKQKDKPIQYMECNGFSISVQQNGEDPSGVVICVMSDEIGRGMIYNNKLDIVAESPIIELHPVWKGASE